jgi:hypothetical protein
MRLLPFNLKKLLENYLKQNPKCLSRQKEVSPYDEKNVLDIIEKVSKSVVNISTINFWIFEPKRKRTVEPKRD